ncbi:TAR DNA-binding protein [Trichinella spiralis]|uniref:TAR DNA-binding protein n=1 Tax=Trichinella spiralis TaxID=6334 RepID=A0ABR3KZT5_TRISP
MAENVVQVSTGVLECPLEKDGTLSLATLRSLLPGARGLWYKPSEFKPIRAIRIDGKSAKLIPPNQGWGDRIYHVSFFETNICPYFGSCLSAIKCPEMHREFQRFITTFKRSASNCSEKDFHDSGITESTSDYCSSSFHDLSEADLSSDSIPYDLYVRQKRCSDPAIECAEKSVRLVKQSQRLLELENEIAELKKLVNESNTTTSRTKQSERKASIECCDSCRNICKNYQMLLDQKGQDIELLLEGYARNRRLIGELSKVGSGNQDEVKDDQKEKILQQMEDIWKQCTEKFQLPRDDKSATDKDDQIEMVVMTESNAEQIDKSDKKKRLESDFESSERALFASEPVKWSGNIVNTWVMTENAEKLKSADQEDVAKLRYKRSLSVERDQDPNKTDTTTTTTTTATEAIERKMVADRSSAMIVDTSAEDECNKWKAMCENLQTI